MKLGWEVGVGKGYHGEEELGEREVSTWAMGELVVRRLVGCSVARASSWWR